MSDRAPAIDGTDREYVFEQLLERADRYLNEWDPDNEDVGHTLIRIFSTFEHDVRQRLNDLPRKHRLAFLDALGFDRHPPQAARTPLCLELSGELGRNVRIPGGTAAVADGPDSGTIQFELPQDCGFEATPADLEAVVAVDPARDAIISHESLVDGEPIALFDGSNRQHHRLYVGHESALHLDDGSTFSIHIQTAADSERIFEDAIWEYYGDDGSGSDGWYRLRSPGETSDADDDLGVEALRERFDSHVSADESQAGVVTRTFEVPGPVVPTTVDDTECRWLRCRVPDGDPVPSIEIDEVALKIVRTGDDEACEPDILLSNDIPIDPDAPTIRPFGRLPQPPVTFFIGCTEALTKPGATVTITFEGSAAGSGDDDATTSAASASNEAAPVSMGVLDGPPVVSWEYWNGEGWTRLGDCRDGTDGFQRQGQVAFEVPNDIESTTVSGHESVWVRARLVDGNYGRPQFDPSAENESEQVVGGPSAPVYDDLSIEYELGAQPPERICIENNGSVSTVRTTPTKPLVPFTELPESVQTLYVGFDDPLENGPLSLFFATDDHIYPRSFDPGVQWEYCTNPSAFEWEKLDFDDGTDGLTERGTVEFTVPTPTEPFEMFGRKQHWIRARVTSDQFVVEDSPTLTDEPVDDRTDDAGRSCGLPTLEGIFMNTAWAYNTVTVTDEVLGSSDCSHEQSFVCSQAPIIDLALWVDEFETLSAGERRRLCERRPERVNEEYDSRGELEGFWVQWDAVEDFLDSGPQDRHFVVDRTLGTIQFGGGDNGRIPPRGVDNVKVTYTTGGGNDGNVDAGTVTDLKSSISMVESVTNPLPAEGGADVESTETLVERTSTRLKHRNRAVTANDYEALAKASFPELARVSCRSSHDAAPRVTVLIVPDSKREKPVPQRELKHRVRETLGQHAPARFVVDDDAFLIVSGPGYAELSVDVTVRAASVRSISALKNRIETTLDEYLHPLAGNHADGWPFGVLPDTASLTAVIDDLKMVGAIPRLDATVEIGETEHVVTESGAQTRLPEDTLVCSGRHEITVITEGE
ncbi:putative baseplate assembly protein [Natranaeroarchaeum aerophilus]|uniref:Baseplate assembly protein n=1 Tax=Natranaeroarchaeum aerophilus TaxID=2917711 RepID=A0AAE3FNN4_9EURY|nr:putative baseplate assembly protein [Natranaeroarchaeum aerophilus]MCL9812058.1 putative baseplate assembly protein [Natranaeroarchaeum aerophilus]